MKTICEYTIDEYKGRIKRLSIILLLITSFMLAGCLTAEESGVITVAAAANFTEPMNEIVLLFHKKTGIQINVISSSSGKLYAQIIAGAPYDIFLSADEKMPRELFRKGLSEEPFIYANGEVVLWSSNKEFCSDGDWRHAINRQKIKKIAIANINTAPYGIAAMFALKNAEKWDAIQGKLVFSQDVSQAFQYAATQSVDAAFCAKSFALSDRGKSGCFLPVKEAPRVVQSACIIKRKELNDAVKQFAFFLISPDAEIIKKKYGYK
jgi:molybdate transport system substrate-binding protein